MEEFKISTELVLWLIGTLTTVLAWIGSRVHVKLDSLQEMLNTKLSAVSETLSKIDKDLRQDLSGIEARVSRIETTIRINHPESHGLDD